VSWPAYAAARPEETLEAAPAHLSLVSCSEPFLLSALCSSARKALLFSPCHDRNVHPLQDAQSHATTYSYNSMDRATTPGPNRDLRLRQQRQSDQCHRLEEPGHQYDLRRQRPAWELDGTIWGQFRANSAVMQRSSNRLASEPPRVHRRLGLLRDGHQTRSPDASRWPQNRREGSCQGGDPGQCDAQLRGRFDLDTLRAGCM